MIGIGTDGGLLTKPETFPYVMLAPAERVELWVDFSGRELGSDLVLYNLDYRGVMPRMGMGGRQAGRGMSMMEDELPQGSKFPLVKFHIVEKISESPRLPSALASFERLLDRNAANPDKPVQIGLSMMHMSPELNGLPFEMLSATESERIPANTIQKIRIFQDEQGMRGGGMGMMMSMAYPIHLHGQQFQILSRSIKEQYSSNYATVRDGFINSGWKDAVLVMPGEEITILKPFQDFTGLYLYHCHILEHEDMGMMRNFLVE